jgi:DNA-binding GntR family transcriptional regulator
VNTLAKSPGKVEAAWEAVSDSVFARLSEAIMSGELAPGSKISEPEVARRFGISRAPLREAIRSLEERNLVTRIPRQGARVISLTPERIHQIFVIREAIEGMAAREAATRITDEEIAALRAGLERQRGATRESGAYPFKTLDTDYHAAIVRASRNEFLTKFLLEDYYALIEICRRRQRSSPERAQQSLVEHGRIVDALAERDPDLAEMLIRRHVAAAREHLIQHLPPQTKEKKR